MPGAMRHGECVHFRTVGLTHKSARMRDILRDFVSELNDNMDATEEAAPCSTRYLRPLLSDIYMHLFDSALTVGAVKHRCGVRNNNVSTHFRRAFGVGPRDYIEALRIDAACRLIRGCPGVEIYLIAMAVGYEHPETFGRAFSRQTRETPSEYRARLLPTDSARSG